MFSRSFIMESDLAGLPIFFEGLRCNRGQLAGLGPGVSGIQSCAFQQWMECLQKTPCPLGKRIDPWPIYDKSEESKNKFFGEGGFLPGCVPSIVQQVMMQVDLDRTDFGACAAKRAGVGEMAPMLQTP